jgi:hypothetical protein
MEKGRHGGKGIFCTCDLFNDAVSNPDYIVSDDRINNELERT